MKEHFGERINSCFDMRSVAAIAWKRQIDSTGENAHTRCEPCNIVILFTLPGSLMRMRTWIHMALIAGAAFLPAHLAAAGPSAGARSSAPTADLSQCASPVWPNDLGPRSGVRVVTLAFLVGADGVVKDAKVDVSSGSPVLDEASISAIRLCAFSAAVRDGMPVEEWMTLQYLWLRSREPARVN